ncbi:hypothetical protein C2S52_017342 [Perilla frutescens var. hirtella]|nr:hypothetical protein C2S52_017342 [Perilla frutescens var. hirtella]
MSLYIWIFSLLLQANSLTGKTNGLKLPLIHPESPEASVSDRIQQRKHQSDEMKGLIRPQVHIQSPYYYMVKINVGTFKTNSQTYYLYMDTGSDLLWLQCEGCRAPGGRCFPQKEPVYPNGKSSSYRPLPCNKHSLCVPNQCINTSCSYNIRYADGTSSSGLLAFENFAFASNLGRVETLQQLMFGCGVDNRNNYGNSSNQIAGIMGLGWGSYSIINQANSVTQGKFSYCLPVVNKYTKKWPITYLKFGTDVIRRPNMNATPLLQIKNQIPYHLILQGISINSKKLNISANEFSSGSCIIDSGTPFSRLIRPAYLVLEKALRKHFWGRLDLKPYKGPKGFELCYERRKAQGFKNLPRMTLHLQKADLSLQPEALFIVMDKIAAKGEYFCLAIIPSDVKTVIGSYQQTNQRLIYETKQKQLLFVVEDCSRDA